SEPWTSPGRSTRPWTASGRGPWSTASTAGTGRPVRCPRAPRPRRTAGGGSGGPARAAPAQDGGWEEAVEACRSVGEAAALVELSADEVRARVQSPVLRAGAFMPGAATVQPAMLARGLRRVLLERGVVIHEGTRVTELDGEHPGWRGSVGAGARRAPLGRGTRGGQRVTGTAPVRVRTTSAAGAGQVTATSAVVALNAWAAA